MSPRAFLPGAAFTALLLALLPLSRAQENVEIKYTPIFAGQAELSLNGACEIDFQNTGQSENDMQFEDWEGGAFWAPRRGAIAVLAGVADFDSFDLNKIDALHPSRDRIELSRGGVPSVQPGTIIGVFTTDGHYAKVFIDSVGETLKFHWTTYEKKILQKAPPPGTLDPPTMTSPPDGVWFEHSPRDLLLTWKTVAGAASYKLELDCQGCCPPRKELFCAEQEGGRVLLATKVMTTSFLTSWSGPYRGRWRVAAVSASGTASAWTPWREFGFKK